MQQLGKYDSIIVGGGPVGAVAAQSAARHGAKVLLIEKGAQPTYPDRCTGIISPRCLEEAQLDASVILREIKGGTIYAPNGRSLQIEAKDTRALVVNRHLFNMKLIEAAQGAGVECLYCSRALDIDGQMVIVERNGTTYQAQAKAIVGADGAKSRVAEAAELPPPDQLLLGLQATARYEPPREDMVNIFVDQHLAPGFFAWIVPAEDGIARVGLATHQMKEAYSLLKMLLDRLNLQPLTINTGLIPLGPRSRTVAKNVLLVGDAAAQAKPTSGGGLYTGIVAAKIAGRVAAQCAEDTGALVEYETAWREKLSRELTLGMSLRRLFQRLNNVELNLIFAILDNKMFMNVVTAHGDIDYPSHIIRALLQQPKTWRKIWSQLPSPVHSVLEALQLIPK